MTSYGDDGEEFARPLGARFEGGGRSLEAAFQQAARLAAENGLAGRLFDVRVRVEPQDHNQWIRTYRVILEEV